MSDDNASNERLRRHQDSLGWLAQSAVQPKKRKEISGVGAASLLALKSQVIKKQHEAREPTAGEEALSAARHGKRRGAIASILEGSNPGVSDRDRRDRLDVKGPVDLLSASQAALERKAELYKRLTSGQGASRDELDSYEVDFLLKGAAPAEPSEAGMLKVTGDMMSRDMMMERERRAWEAEVEASCKSETLREQRANERRNIIRKVEEETARGRARAAEARQERLELEARKRDRLKAEFLKRRIEAAALKTKKAGTDPQ